MDVLSRVERARPSSASGDCETNIVDNLSQALQASVPRYHSQMESHTCRLKLPGFKTSSKLSVVGVVVLVKEQTKRTTQPGSRPHTNTVNWSPTKEQKPQDREYLTSATSDARTSGQSHTNISLGLVRRLSEQRRLLPIPKF